MNFIKYLFLLVLTSINIFSQSIRNQEIKNIKEVLINGQMELNISYDSKESLTFEGKDSIINDVKIKVRGTLLEISLPKKSYLSINDKIIVKLNLKELNSLEFNGSGDFLIKDFKSEDFYLKIDGNGKGLVEGVTFDKFNVDINGNANILLKGKSKNLIVKMDGLGSFNGYELPTDSAELTLNGAGKIEVSVEKKLKAKLNGIGSIVYKGNPKVEEASLKGLGSIKKYQD